MTTTKVTYNGIIRYSSLALELDVARPTPRRSVGGPMSQTLPKALRTQGLTALTSNLGLVGLVQYGWQVWFGKFGFVGLIR